MAPQTLDHKEVVVVSVADEQQHQRAERVQRAQWLRAAILGANDGLLSTTSLMLGVGAAKEDRRSMVLSGISGAIAGACSMAVGEFISVSTQRDIEKMGVSDSEAQLHGVKLIINSSTATASPITNSSSRLSELTSSLPMSPAASRRISELSNSAAARSPMMRVITEDEKSKAREEIILPNPVKAAAASALAFLCGSLVPLVSAFLVNDDKARIYVLALATSIALALFGGIGAHLGGSPAVGVSAARVLFGGWAAMAITFALLKPFDNDDRKS
ncbi:hypothetical protein HHK36_010518 [Tetracentron sinense]|uniref:Vacuolar iron transporter n=1 Tax=Tetracentron sinense TaxID=13715 RepID=A0A834ZF13_TETSI|nr:hypothetical protein HHK36_010518 [Tetracentron sinense]